MCVCPQLRKAHQNGSLPLPLGYIVSLRRSLSGDLEYRILRECNSKIHVRVPGPVPSLLHKSDHRSMHYFSSALPVSCCCRAKCNNVIPVH